MRNRQTYLALGHRAISSTMVYVGTSDLQASEAAAQAMRYPADMERREFQHDGLRFSFLDSGGDGDVLIALHAHLMEAVTYAPLAAALPKWRVVALDQRGHGYSDHSRSYTRNDYIQDVEALFEHLDLNEAVLLGNSLGGANAYQFAARHPERVRGLIE